jgi:signal peptidase I
MAFRVFNRRGYVDPTPEKAKETPASFLKSLAILAILAWILRSLIVAPFSIPSGSMLPTMMIGDYLFVSKWPYGYSRVSFLFGFPSFDGRIFGSMPERGDIVVFLGPEKADVVKRVIGLPGDIVAVQGGQIVLNGKTIPRERVNDVLIPISPNSPCRVIPPAVVMVRPMADGERGCTFPAYRETLPIGRNYVVLDHLDNSDGDYFGPMTVPNGSIFVMGDNRDDSGDSRFDPPNGVGLVPIDRVVGRAELAFWSTDGSASWINPISWFTALRTDRLGTDYHP